MKGYLLESRSGAKRWGEAYPVGNGHLGAMIYGGVPVNRIDLSQNTFYSGRREESKKRNTGPVFQKMREKAEQNEFGAVHQLAEEFIGKRGNYGTNLPVGSLYLSYGTGQQKVHLMSRSLSIMEGVAERKIAIEKTDTIITETIIASNPDRVLAIKIEGTSAFDIEMQIELATEGSVSCQHDIGLAKIIFDSHAYETMHCDEKTGVSLHGEAKMVTDGKTYMTGRNIGIEKCQYVYFFLNMQTDFTERMGWESDFQKRSFFAEEIFSEKMTDVSGKYIKDLYDRHVQDISARMKRNMIRLKDQEGREQQDVTFLYQYGRYLLLASSREDSILPAHLQGIWNDNVACRIGWTCDMHLDINTQMNYWPAEVTNLSETTEPLFHWIEKGLWPEGIETARKFYGFQGWAAEIVSNAWGYARPYWAVPIAPCPTGGIWILTHMWEHYLYSQDLIFLSERFFPILRSAIVFFQEYIFETPKGISCGPSISPENSFLQEGIPYQISNGCTYEITLIRELFLIYLAAMQRLHPEDAVEIARLQKITEQLLPYRITDAGTIAEYDHDFQIPDQQHRHTSHLLGLFPFSQITREKNSDLCTAAQLSIRQKLLPIEGWEETGWADNMLVLYEARLGCGDAAYEHICRIEQNLLEPNGMIFHPPTRGADAFDHVYELDGNTGFTAGVAEMLVQSHDDLIQLLPALPEVWADGEVSGMKVRGSITIDFMWQKKKVIRLSCSSGRTQSVTFRMNGETYCFDLMSGIDLVWESKLVNA